MNITEIAKAITPLSKLIHKEATTPLLAEIKQLKLELAEALKTRVPKDTVAPLVAENRQLKAKLRRALAQRDEWKYHARRYHATILEKGLRAPAGRV